MSDHALPIKINNNTNLALLYINSDGYESAQSCSPGQAGTDQSMYKLGDSDEINQQFKMFDKPEGNSIKARFMGKNQLNKDHYVMRFELPEENKCVGLKIGQYIWVEIDG